MGLLSLFCCVDAKDDSEDKYHRQPTKRQPAVLQKTTLRGVSAPATDKDAPKRAATAPQPTAAPVAAASSKKELMDEDHSLNETETITNTNEESNATPVVAEDEAKLLDAPLIEDEERHASNESQADCSMDDEPLSLSKIQEGQSFNPETGALLAKKDLKRFSNKKCLVLDLDETLVHSSFKYLRTADFVIPVEIDNQVHHVYVIKRPGVDEFLERVGRWYEVVVFTASVSKYGDPLLDKLDISKSVHHRLFRDSCYNHQGNFIKNLSQIGRPLSDCIIIDNSPASYIFHPQHSVPISSWFSDTHDNELLDLLPFLEDLSKQNVDDVALVLEMTI